MTPPNIAKTYGTEDGEPTAVFGAFDQEPPSAPPASIARLRSSYSDEDLIGDTGVSDLVTDLARLSDPLCVPRLHRAISRSEVLSPPEAFVASLVDGNMNMQAILDMSPLREDDTLRFLARLVEKGIIRLTQAEPAPRASCPSYVVNTDDLWD